MWYNLSREADISVRVKCPCGWEGYVFDTKRLVRRYGRDDYETIDVCPECGIQEYDLAFTDVTGLNADTLFSLIGHLPRFKRIKTNTVVQSDLAGRVLAEDKVTCIFYDGIECGGRECLNCIVLDNCRIIKYTQGGFSLCKNEGECTECPVRYQCKTTSMEIVTDIKPLNGKIKVFETKGV